MKQVRRIAFILTFVCNSICDEVILKTAQGTIRGVKFSDKGYNSFNGIPYAGHINENSRFRKAPLPGSWSGVRDALSPSSPCLSITSGHLQGQEDCLYLNVHVPHRSLSEPLFPVLVWVHGVGFTSSTYGPAYLVKHKIILVTLNYRLGAFGFLCMGHENAPGNAGAKDVVLALRWVRDNIVAFGGDAAHVTLAGQGTGAAIVDALTMSKSADGLYHRVIIQSGTILSPWAFNYDAVERANSLARLFDKSRDINDRVKSLLHARASDIMLQSRNILSPYFPFSMCLEKSFRNEEKLLPDYPINLLKNNQYSKVPYMIGFNTKEGSIFGPLYKYMKRKQKVLIIPEELIFHTKSEKLKVTEKINDNYFGSSIDYSSFVNYMTDAFFLNHIYRNIQKRLSQVEQPVYLYELDLFGDNKNSSGHGDELKLLFGTDNADHSSDEAGLVQNLWTNFVKFGNPTPFGGGVIPVNWNPATKGNIQLLKISGNVEMKQFEKSQKMLMWDDLYEIYYYSRLSLSNESKK